MKAPGKEQIAILSDQAIFSGTSFLITVGVARILSIEDFGRYAVNILTIYLAISMLSAFVIQPFQVLMGKAENMAAYISFNFWLHVTGTVTILVVAYIAATLWRLEIPFAVWTFAAGFLFHDFSRRLLLTLNKPIATLVLDIVVAISLLTAMAFFYLSSSADYSALYKVFSLAYIFPLPLILFNIRPFSVNKIAFATFFKWHIQSGKWLFLTAITQWWSSNLLIVASGLYLGTAALGALRLAQSLMGILNILLQTFENYVLPQTARRINYNVERGVSYLADVSRKAAFLFLPVVALCFLFAEKIMVIAGGQSYQSYGYVLQGIAILYILVFISQPIRLLVRSMMLHQHFFYGYLFSLIGTMACSHLLISKLGLTGAIIGLATSQFILITYWILILQKRNLQLWRSFISF